MDIRTYQGRDSSSLVNLTYAITNFAKKMVRFPSRRKTDVGEKQDACADFWSRLNHQQAVILERTLLGYWFEYVQR